MSAYRDRLQGGGFAVNVIDTVLIAELASARFAAAVQRCAAAPDDASAYPAYAEARIALDIAHSELDTFIATRARYPLLLASDCA